MTPDGPRGKEAKMAKSFLGEREGPNPSMSIGDQSEKCMFITWKSKE